MSTEQAKGWWIGLDPDEQIETALKYGLFEDMFGIDSNPIYRKLASSSQLQYNTSWDFF
jgi:hypothetical protein